MTPEQILDLAGEVDKHKHWNDDGSNRLVTFAKLIEAHTRAECARVCREMQNGFASDQHIECAEAIERMK